MKHATTYYIDSNRKESSPHNSRKITQETNFPIKIATVYASAHPELEKVHYKA